MRLRQHCPLKCQSTDSGFALLGNERHWKRDKETAEPSTVKDSLACEEILFDTAIMTLRSCNVVGLGM